MSTLSPNTWCRAPYGHLKVVNLEPWLNNRNGKIQCVSTSGKDIYETAPFLQPCDAIEAMICEELLEAARGATDGNRCKA